MSVTADMCFQLSVLYWCSHCFFHLKLFQTRAIRSCIRPSSKDLCFSFFQTIFFTSMNLRGVVSRGGWGERGEKWKGGRERVKKEGKSQQSQISLPAAISFLLDHLWLEKKKVQMEWLKGEQVKNCVWQEKPEKSSGAIIAVPGIAEVLAACAD